MRTIDLRGQTLTPAELLAAVPRANEALAAAHEAAAGIVAAVRDEGEPALRAQAARFDGVEEHAIRVPQAHIDEALGGLDAEVRAALDESIARVREGSAAQVPAPRTTDIAPGARVSQRWQPVARAGVYVPGGKAVYPSSVVMNVVPAQTAGVGSIALASPPQRAHGGRVHPTILAVAGLLGIDEVYAIGGAGAIGAFAHGVPGLGLAAVDVVTGPGNNFVAAAKRIVSATVGTDAEAGATEILIAADDTADARLIAYDLVSQAEHDEQAASVLVTTSPELARDVQQRLETIAPATRHSDRVQTALDGPQSAIVLVDDAETMERFSNAYGPEHLELHVADARAAAARYTNAGALFVGSATPVSLGDYLAGSNHVLPTGGQSRYGSGLGAYTFLRPQQVVEYDRAALESVTDRVVALANAEALPAHGEAVAARFS
ncbi:histidinol dehydrogenase [Microbacterium suaedae]|uniref:histidinol dehydrogenase n=1 Tax=Microbacterium suaedae TaxID=2067813 RepID=UPI000DA21FD1|nr:histidinol dehydrogenase [Microbacterium suaedae]